MAALANVFFRDIFCHVIPGASVLPTATGYATGTASGVAIQLGGLAPIGKLLARLNFAAGSVSGVVAMWFATATASSGAFTSIAATLVSIATTLSLSTQYYLGIDTRNEAFCNLASATSGAPTWCQVVMSVSGSAIGGAMEVLGWECGSEPASTFDSAAAVVKYTTFY